MQRPSIWFEREFNFSFSYDMFPNLIERLRGTPARLEELLSHVEKSRIINTLGSTEWSMKQQVGHLSDLEPLWDGRLDDFLKSLEMLRPADLENKKTHNADHNKVEMHELLVKFRSSRREFVVRLESISDEAIQATSHHPRLKTPMRLIDMLFFVAEHDDHHLAMITYLKNKTSE